MAAWTALPDVLGRIVVVFSLQSLWHASWLGFCVFISVGELQVKHFEAEKPSSIKISSALTSSCWRLGALINAVSELSAVSASRDAQAPGRTTVRPHPYPYPCVSSAVVTAEHQSQLSRFNLLAQPCRDLASLTARFSPCLCPCGRRGSNSSHWCVLLRHTSESSLWSYSLCFLLSICLICWASDRPCWRAGVCLWGDATVEKWQLITGICCSQMPASLQHKTCQTVGRENIEFDTLCSYFIFFMFIFFWRFGLVLREIGSWSKARTPEQCVITLRKHTYTWCFKGTLCTGVPVA